MAIFTSYYSGEILGEAVSISIFPPKDWKGKQLPLFAPTKELLDWWKKSPQDAAAQAEYERQFLEILLTRQQLIDLWVSKQQQTNADITLCCYEKPQDFCHRHIVGREVIARYLPDLWGGEVGDNSAKSRDSNNTSISELICFKQRNSSQGHKQFIAPEPIIKKSTCSPINEAFPPVIIKLLLKCHQAGFQVRCDHTHCGYYQISLGEEDLGIWSELGVLVVLGGLHEQFYRERLIPSMAAAKETAPATVEAVLPSPSTPKQQPELITRLSKLEGEQLIKIQDWCNSIKPLMFSSVSQYADGRMELHLRRFVSLTSAKSGKKAEVKMVEPSMYPGSAEIEVLGEKLLPEFHQALILFYPAGTQIKVHRDSPAYAAGAAQINVIGRARFSISGCQDVRRMESYWLDEGDCIAFDNKQPHGIERVESARWCICFFKLKAEYLLEQKTEQLSLI